MNFAPIYKKREILCLTLVHGIETLVVAPSPLGHSSKASSPCSRKEIRERQGSLAQLEVMALRIRQNVRGRSVAETVKSFAALIHFPSVVRTFLQFQALFAFGRNEDKN